MVTAIPDMLQLVCCMSLQHCPAHAHSHDRSCRLSHTCTSSQITPALRPLELASLYWRRLHKPAVTKNRLQGHIQLVHAAH